MKPLGKKYNAFLSQLSDAPPVPECEVKVLNAQGKPVSTESGEWGKILVFSQIGTHKLFMPGDPHLDSKYCDLDLFYRHMTRAVLEGRRIVIPGDIFDAMQGRFDNRRANYDALEQWRQIIKRAADILTPFANNLLAWSLGNHETKVLKYSQIDLLHELSLEIQQRTNKYIPVMDYNWWLMHRVRQHPNNSAWVTAKGLFWHGWGGANRVGKGSQHNMHLQEMANYDYSVMGHTHSAYEIPTEYYDLQVAKGKIYQVIRQRLGLRTGSYMLPHSMFAKEKGMGPSPRGGRTLDLKIHRTSQRVEDKVSGKKSIEQRFKLSMESTGWTS